MHAPLPALPCLALLALAACTPQTSGPSSSRNRIFPVDMAGKAAECTAPAVALTRGQAATGAISTGGGGWCGIPVTLGGDALAAGLLTNPAKSGRVYIHTVGDETRVDYTPSGPVLADAFTVQFLPGDEIMRVTVSNAAAGRK